jgi:hypothetical protein
MFFPQDDISRKGERGYKVLYVFSLLSLFWKNRSRLMRSPCSLCILPINFWMPEPILMKLGMYITAHEPISTAYSAVAFYARDAFLKTSHNSRRVLKHIHLADFFGIRII